MRNFNDLWIWLTALKSSIPFVTAVAILFAGLLATLVDWIELYLTADQQDAAPMVIRQRCSGTPAWWSLRGR